MKGRFTNCETTFHLKPFKGSEKMNDTIVALATAQVEGAIAIIRLSGPKAIALADALYQGKQRLTDCSTHTIQYGKIIHPQTQNPIDEVLINIFRAPRTYTREDVIEINCHGGINITNTILELLLGEGARLADPGEFTKRAFLNGRIDLTQAEAVSDIIAAESEKAAAVAIDALDGKLSRQIINFREATVEILANIEVNIDYPEYDDVEQLTTDILLPKITKLNQAIQTLLQTAHTGQLLKNGIKTAIIGRPNVGKSSLLNTLLREQKAIVTEVAGTTRDIVEGNIKLHDLTLHIIDTAGIRDTEDIVEKIGIAKAHAVLETAELTLLVLDRSTQLTASDKTLLQAVANKNCIIILNKSDLPQNIDLPTDILHPIVTLSAKMDTGIEKLYDELTNLLSVNIHTTNNIYLSNIRHINLLKTAQLSLQQAIESAQTNMPIDIITIDLQNCYSALGEILGVEIKDDLLDTLFSRFCLGK